MKPQDNGPSPTPEYAELQPCPTCGRCPRPCEACEAAERATAAGVTLPRAIVKALIDRWPLCGVCTGNSPSWDGHNVNPPCVGYAREQAKAALNG